MDLIVKHFNELSTTELYEILKTRFEIFVTEQECIYQDLDDKDQDAIHVFCYNVRWKKLPNSRIDLPDYIERPIHEALVNAFVHRDYMEIGSEVHLDIFDNRIEITSPGGMVEGLPIQKRDLYHIASRRRNPYLADIFHRLQLMERSGSGIKEIMNDYKASVNITEDRLPTFFSDESDFNVTFWNLNYGVGQISSGESNGESSGEVTEKSNGIINLNNTEKQIIELIGENSTITQKDLALQIGLSEGGIRKAMTKLKKAGIIRREGSTNIILPYRRLLSLESY